MNFWTEFKYQWFLSMLKSLVLLANVVIGLYLVLSKNFQVNRIF